MKTQILMVSAKCSDVFTAALVERETNTSGSKVDHCISEYEGYVPNWFPNPKSDNDGDYVQLDIDIETGQILNWKKPTKKDLTIFKP